MSKINMSTDVPISPDELWKLIGGFNAFVDLGHKIVLQHCAFIRE